MTDDELARLRVSLSQAHVKEDLGLFLTIVERIRNRFLRSAKLGQNVLTPQSRSRAGDAHNRPQA